MIKKIICIFIFSFSFGHSTEIKLKSLIMLKDKIPNECGININILDDNEKTDLTVSIKKNQSNTTTNFFAKSNFNVDFYDINTESESISKIIKVSNRNADYYEIEAETDQNRTNQFFQELIISGAKVFINKKQYEVIGPIDSKVRLEYLFCTGEMFLPNYEANQNE